MEEAIQRVIKSHQDREFILSPEETQVVLTRQAYSDLLDLIIHRLHDRIKYHHKRMEPLFQAIEGFEECREIRLACEESFYRDRSLRTYIETFINKANSLTDWSSFLADPQVIKKKIDDALYMVESITRNLNAYNINLISSLETIKDLPTPMRDEEDECEGDLESRVEKLEEDMNNYHHHLNNQVDRIDSVLHTLLRK